MTILIGDRVSRWRLWGLYVGGVFIGVSIAAAEWTPRTPSGVSGPAHADAGLTRVVPSGGDSGHKTARVSADMLRTHLEILREHKADSKILALVEQAILDIDLSDVEILRGLVEQNHEASVSFARQLDEAERAVKQVEAILNAERQMWGNQAASDRAEIQRLQDRSDEWRALAEDAQAHAIEANKTLAKLGPSGVEAEQP